MNKLARFATVLHITNNRPFTVRDGSEADGDHVLIQTKGGISYIPWITLSTHVKTGRTEAKTLLASF